MMSVSCVSPPQTLPRIPPPSTGGRGSPCSSCAASSSSTAWTSPWSAWRSPASTPTSTCPPRRCSGWSAATCSATAGCCCSAAAPPICSAAGASCSWRSACSPARRWLGALVDSGPLLIAARFIKGAAAGFTAPAGLSIITTTFPEGPLRNRALGIYTATGASGFSLGLVLGGVLTTAGWRWTFLLPFPIAAVLLIVAARVLRPDPAVGPRGPLRHRRRRLGHRGDARARVRRLRRARRGLGLGADARLARRRRRAARGVPGDRDCASRTRSCGSGSCARP